MDYLQIAAACIDRAGSKWPGGPTARYRRLNEIHHFLQVRRGSPRAHLKVNFDEHARRLTGARHQAWKQGQ